MRVRRAAIALTTLLLAAGTILAEGASAPRGVLKLATWNLEWLITPEAFEQLKRGCATESPRGEGRVLPCDLVPGGEHPLNRQPADFARLREYAQHLDADVVALQEVDGPAAARLVFPGYRFCFTRRDHLQNVGFAIRAGLPFECGPDLRALGLYGSVVRWGADLTLYPGAPEQLRLLSIHLKSGCNRQVLTNPKDDCRLLATQVPALERWIDARASEGVPFAVIGDFNRRMLAERIEARDRRGRLQALWPEIDDGDPPESDLVNAAEGEPYVGCHSGDHFPTYVDHIVLSRTLAARRVPGSLQRVRFEDADLREFRLSDHCPVAVEVRLIPALRSR